MVMVAVMVMMELWGWVGIVLGRCQLLHKRKDEKVWGHALSN
jgi:hypothetical protein